VLARLLWDPREEVEGIVGDYLEKGFGEAAPTMRRYYERWKCSYSGGIRFLAARDLTRAWAASAVPEVRRRVERQALYLRHLRLLDAYRSVRDDWDRVRALESLVSFDWRLAPLNIAHTVPLVEVYLRRDARWRLGLAEAEFDGWKDSRLFSPQHPAKTCGLKAVLSLLTACWFVRTAGGPGCCDTPAGPPAGTGLLKYPGS